MATKMTRKMTEWHFTLVRWARTMEECDHASEYAPAVPFHHLVEDDIGLEKQACGLESDSW